MTACRRCKLAPAVPYAGWLWLEDQRDGRLYFLCQACRPPASRVTFMVLGRVTPSWTAWLLFPAFVVVGAVCELGYRWDRVRGRDA